MTPSQETCPDLVARMSGFWESMGSKITLLDALSHDRALAISSHLPHMVASALSLSTPHEFLPFVGKGWLDSTRIAGSNPQLWRQILEENQEPALHALKKFATICETWIEALEGSDFDRVEELLQSGKTTRESVASRHTSS